tara:strand:- start:170 stop:919 length:750 start_codon:yes stop_codon:yes gene_type:complete
MANHFTIIIPSYNNERWTKRCLGSALTQDYDNYDVVYVNDKSTDDTASVVKKTIKETETSAEIRIVDNKENRKALYNLFHEIRKSKSNSIIVTLDGDDWLPNDKVLKTLNEVYSSGDIWMTAGSYISGLGGWVNRPNVKNKYWNGNIRMKPWTISHLRTFRRELFMKIKYDDLMDNDGYFYKFTFDQAMMYPMAEMSGPEHFREINKIMYVYNRDNPISVDKVHRKEQLRIEKQIRYKEPYKRLESLDV